MNAAIIYWSKTGNTEKVAHAIREGLVACGVEVSLEKIEGTSYIDFYAYDLVCVGFPSHHWRPAKPMDTLLNRKFSEYRKQGLVKIGGPKIPGKKVLIFCTYSGPHTGIKEAIPAGKCAGQYFEHLGFTVLDEWYILGEFHGSEEKSTKGRMGDIRGRPNDEDLRKIKKDVILLLQRI